MDKIRIGIIGTGGIAHSHMRAYLQMDDIEIIGASDIVPGKARAFLDEFGLTSVPAFEDNKELLALKPDGVSVCTYNTQHHTCACEAMRAGANVLCEKPMSVTLDQAVQMAKCQKETGKILTIGFQPRYGENMKMIKHLVRSGELGHIYYIQTGGGRRRGIPGRTFVQKDLAGVGCLADIGCYGLDMALNAVGYRKPVTVSAYASDYFGKNPKYYDPVKGGGEFSVDDFTCALIRFEDGLVMDFRMSWAMHMDTMGDTLFLGTEAGGRHPHRRPFAHPVAGDHLQSGHHRRHHPLQRAEARGRGGHSRNLTMPFARKPVRCGRAFAMSVRFSPTRPSRPRPGWPRRSRG